MSTIFNPSCFNTNKSTDIRVAKVHVLFKLPDRIHPEPLAYVTYATTFQKPTRYSQLYQFSWATKMWNHHRYPDSAVIPVSRIIRTCHLIPAFEKAVDRTWQSHSVLDSTAKFYLNPYLRFRDFILFRYLLPKSIEQDTQVDLPTTKRIRR